MSNPARASIYNVPDGSLDAEELMNSDPNTIAQQLASRLAKEKLFTKIGGRFMIALRPNRGSSVEALSKEYAAKAKESASKQTLPAHVFNIATSAFIHAKRTTMDQSIVLMGESGSGKSEIYRMLLRNLCDVSKTSEKKSKVHSYLLKIDPILSAFGHATTPHNLDATCFTHYTELQFDAKGKMVGAKLIEYLLEKSRVSGPLDGGLNFHIFYYLLEGSNHEERVQWHLSDAAHFNYLTGSNIVGFAQGKGAYLEILKGHMKSLGIGRRQQSQVWQLLAAILHLGNIQFKEPLTGETCAIKNYQQLQLVSDMLGVTSDALKIALTSRVRTVGKDNIVEFFDEKQAAVQRDSLARNLFATCFTWIVEQINQKLCAADSDFNRFVSILEVPGFAGTSGTRNDFNRLLVNFANEKLYSHTMYELFEMSKEAFVEQGLDFPDNSYTSNQEILNVLCSEKKGVLRLLDHESVARTSDEAMTAKVYEQFLSTGVLISANSKKLFSAFGIHHFAGVVEYDTVGFGESERDVLQSDYVTLIRGDPENPGTTNPFLRSLFSDRIIATRKAKDSTVLSATPRGRTPSLRRKPSKRNADDENETLDTSATIGHMYRVEINNILDSLCSTQSWFITCINPSINGKASLDLIKKQVVAYDLGSLVGNPSTVFTAAYSCDEFVTRYKPILSLYDRDPKAACQTMMRYKNWKSTDAIVGKSMIFLNENNWQALELSLTEKENALEAEKLPKQPIIAAVSPRESLIQPTSKYAESVDGSEYSDDSASHYESEFDQPERLSGTFGDLEMGKFPKSKLQTSIEPSKPPVGPPPAKPLTQLRKNWLCCTWSTTWCFPSSCLRCCGMKDKDRQLAWREKFALCVIIFLMNVFVLFVIVGIGYIICRKGTEQSPGEISGRYTLNSKAAVYMFGKYYVIPDLVPAHIPMMPQKYATNDYWTSSVLGHDVTYMFPNQAFGSTYCKKAVPPNFKLRQDVDLDSPWVMHGVNSGKNFDHFPLMKSYEKGRIVVTVDYVKNSLIANNPNARYIIIEDNVYDLTPFYTVDWNPSQTTNWFLGAFFKNMSDAYTRGGQVADIAPVISQFKAQPDYKLVMDCLNGLFLIGGIDHRNDLICVIPNYILLAFSIILVSVIGFKFVAALQFPGRRAPEDHDKFVICQVPCYTEGEVSLRRTIDSLANLRYDDKHKLLFIICDGMIIGSGNDRPTPRIVLDILGADPANDPESFCYQSLGDGNDQLNYGKVYSGLYEHNGHIVPYIVVVKVGKPSERKKPGNRGKRDSQLILMRLLSRVHFNQAMSPLELEMYHNMKNVIGVDPSFYEYVFMVDADTMVDETSLNYLVSQMTRDAKIVGNCGETSIANDRKSFTSMIQVYEYFISHHLSKAFESLFGSVTCLPGCFCMYRVRTNKNVPVLVAPGLIADYSENTVDTLHLKNLLHLGEDRYLTTLTMKHFPQMRTTFCPDASCKTYAPEKWQVLLSQRRRWINSTVHNLFELLRLGELCGFCCVSMRFVVFIDLIATFIQPSSLLYVGYLVYLASTDNLSNIPIISLVLIGAVYGFQVVIFLLKTQWQHIGWMFFYLLGIPLFGMYIPLYSFWHFDDFSWGNTRLAVEGADSKVVADKEPEYFDPASVPLVKWSDYEAMHKDSSSESKSKAGYSQSVTASNYSESLGGDSIVYQDMVLQTPMMPSDEDILQEIRHILSTTDLMKITKKSVRDRLSRLFGVNVTAKKDYIHYCIDAILKGEL